MLNPNNSIEQETYPLSPLQQGMLFHYLYNQEGGKYIQQFICRLHEALNIPAFEQSWQKVIERHSILRTRFQWEGLEQPQQIVHKQVECPLKIQDLCDLSSKTQKKQIADYIQQDRKKGFSLTEAPVMRFTLFQLSEDNYQFIWTSHHILLDGRSRFLILRELFTLYAGYCQNQEIELPEPHPYKEYIDWLQQQDFSKSELFWQKTLKGVQTPTPLINGWVNDSDSVTKLTYADKTLHLTETLTKDLQSLAKSADLTLNTLMQGVWALLLSRYSGEETVIFGATRACRYWTDIEPKSRIGLFINTLPVCTHLTPTLDLLTWLQDLRQQWVDMRDHEHTPLSDIQKWSDISTQHPLFETIIVFENYEINTTLSALGSDWTKREFQLLQQNHYPLSLYVTRDTSLNLTFKYEPQRFDAATINRMSGHFQTLLEGIVANPKQRISALPWLTQAEKHQLLIDWNKTDAEYPQTQCVHQLFEAQVAKTPEAIAVTFEKQQLTYRELNRRANQLAHYLQSLGVQAEVLVGIYVERSIEMLVGLLGILKAGGAYVPLDPAYPIERLAFMLADSQVRVLLTQQDLVASLPAQAQVVCLDKDWERISHESEANLINTASLDNLAYVIYTSGSTGKPKGVQIQHRSLTNFLLSLRQTPGLSEQDTLLAITTISFDIAALELYLPLIVGAKIVLVSREVAADGLQLLAKLNQAGITVMQATPATWRLLLSAGWKSSNHLKIFIGGEALPQELAHQLLNKGKTIWNLYGPTETTIWSSVFQVGVQEAIQTKGESIGRPIANTQIYLLDQYLQAVPIGVSGELHIGGAGLARGYLNRPELTAEKFIQNPFSDDSDARLYKTGDLARYLPDGNIEYLGRLDHQVKLRGFRIELGEIEAVLVQHPEVHEAVVIIREVQPGDKRLVAYLVPTKAQEVMPKTLRQFIKEKLPDYMVPSAFVKLEAMPLTPNGKVDRRALPLPDMLGGIETDFVSPRTPIEEVLAAIWAEILKVEKVGIHDNFFELGGHSLLATQVISRLRDAFEVELPLRELFESPTIANFSKHIDETSRQNNIRILPAIKLISRTEKLPLSFPQQRLWFLDQLEKERDTHHMSISLRLTGTVNLTALEQSLTEMVCRHENLRTTFQFRNGEAVQIIASPFPVKLPVVFLQNKSEVEQRAEIQRLATQAHQQPFELAQGPLLRFTLLRLREQSHILLLTIHHVIFDGWSIKIFIRELSTLHTAFSIGEPSPLPKLPIQYADFAYWQRQWLTGEVLETLLNYWKQQLKEAPPLLELPTDRPRPSIQTYRGAKQVSELSPSLSQGLKTLSRQASVTLFITLLSAFKLLLSRYTGQTNIVVGTPIAGRNRTELENLMGFFINTQVLYTDLSGNPSFHELLSRVREVALGAYAHQELPFEKLVEELQPERNLSYTPLFQVWFNMINLADSQNEKQNEQSGLTIERFSLSEEIPSQFDLTLYVQEKDQAIQLTFVYNVDLFDATTITRLIGHFQTLLENIVTDPDKRLSSLRLLTERHHLSTRGNLVHPTIPFIEFEKREQSIPARFEEQVIKYSDQIAIKTMRYTWTYRDLNEKANQVAQAILKQEERVALLFEHDAPMLIGIMGVLKAGKTYVPLNPYSPRERLEYIVQDSQASAILTNDQNQSLAQALTSNTLRLINIDEIKLVASRDEIQPTLSADSIAYLLYTSGTSGKPKAVIQNHRNVLHFIRTYTNHLHITANDKLTLLSSYSFDAAIMDIFGALLNGATLYPVNLKEESLSHLSSWLIQQEVTLYHSTPTVYRHWLNTVTEERFPKIRLVVLGGEPVYKDDVDKYKKHFSTNCIFINGLGPTESTVSLQYFINHQTEITHQAVPVGYPVAETEILLLNETGEETDIYGEIAIKSPYIALGYWQKPELTQTVFLTDGDNQRLYRTGDMGRLRADGSIEFVGRKDFQVKLRGFRIELREVEAVLSQHPAVQETVVMLREETAGEKRLVAYWVPNQVPVTDTIELRRFIQEKLPDYMIPSAFVKLEAMPLTANGKVDRRALPVPDMLGGIEADFVPPRTPAEEILATIWAEILKVEKVGIHDNFFELGGHSLLATQVMSRIRDAFSVEIPLRYLFEAPTMAALAVKITQSQAEKMVPDEITELLAELEGLSDEEAQKLLIDEG